MMTKKKISSLFFIFKLRFFLIDHTGVPLVVYLREDLVAHLLDLDPGFSDVGQGQEGRAGQPDGHGGKVGLGVQVTSND